MLAQAADLLKVFGHRFRAGPDMQLFIDVPDMRVNCGIAEIQLLGNFPVKVSPGETIKNLLLAQGKLFVFMHRVGDLLE